MKNNISPTIHHLCSEKHSLVPGGRQEQEWHHRVQRIHRVAPTTHGNCADGKSGLGILWPRGHVWWDVDRGGDNGSLRLWDPFGSSWHHWVISFCIYVNFDIFCNFIFIYIYVYLQIYICIVDGCLADRERGREWHDMLNFLKVFIDYQTALWGFIGWFKLSHQDDNNNYHHDRLVDCKWTVLKSPCWFMITKNYAPQINFGWS